MPRGLRKVARALAPLDVPNDGFGARAPRRWGSPAPGSASPRLLPVRSPGLGPRSGGSWARRRGVERRRARLIPWSQGVWPRSRGSIASEAGIVCSEVGIDRSEAGIVCSEPGINPKGPRSLVELVQTERGREQVRAWLVGGSWVRSGCQPRGVEPHGEGGVRGPRSLRLAFCFTAGGRRTSNWARFRFRVSARRASCGRFRGAEPCGRVVLRSPNGLERGHVRDVLGSSGSSLVCYQVVQSNDGDMHIPHLHPIRSGDDLLSVEPMFRAASTTCAGAPNAASARLTRSRLSLAPEMSRSMSLVARGFA